VNTKHIINIGNSQNLKEVPDESVNLIVTSPPYPMIEMWDEIFGKLNNEITEALNNEDGVFKGLKEKNSRVIFIDHDEKYLPLLRRYFRNIVTYKIEEHEL